MESNGLIKKEDGVESAKICRWCLTAGDALKALMLDGSGQYKVQKIFDFTDVQLELSPRVPSYLCTTCESRLEKMDTFRWRCNEKSDTVDKFIKRQNTAKNVSDIAQNHLDHCAQKTIVTELTIKTEATAPDAATDLHLIQRSCTAPQVNGTHECYGKQPFEAEENPITIKLEYVDVDELYRLQTNAILAHEQNDLRTNPLELVCQDREDHSVSKNMCADRTELLIKTEVTTPDAAPDLHLNQKCCTVHEANRTYECCGKIPDDLFEAEENPIAIKSEEVDEQHQLQTTNGVLGQDKLKSHRKNIKHHCPHCYASFPVLSKFKNHIRRHTGERPYQCKVCDKNFFSSRCLAIHSIIHNKDQHHQCPHCSSIFVRLSSLENHIRIHTGERPYQCKVCDKAFHSSNNLAQHSKIHNRDEHHQCPHCTATFPRLTVLKDHIRIHNGEKPFVCKICNQAFPSSTALSHHLKIHKDQQLRCPHCSSMFAQTSDLRNHIRRHSTFQCKVCGKVFRSSMNLARHSKIHNKGERSHHCKICDKAFYSSNTLAQHSKIHNKDQQHQCPYCSAMFAQTSGLKIHIRTHTGEKPYRCKVCDKAFHSSSNQAKHSKIHKKGENC